MKAADITDEEMLAAVDEAIRVRSAVDGGSYEWATRWDVHAALAGRPDVIGQGPELFDVLGHSDIPEKVVLAKASRMVRRGRLDGCACGCRGDWSRPRGGAWSTDLSRRY